LKAQYAQIGVGKRLKPKKWPNERASPWR